MNCFSRELDRLFSASADPETTARFLTGLGPETAAGAIAGSWTGARLFYLDFFDGLGYETRREYMDMLVRTLDFGETLSPAYFVVLARQILKSQGAGADEMKYRYRLKQRVAGLMKAMPYMSCFGDGFRGDMAGYDAAISSALQTPYGAAGALNGFSDREFSRYVSDAPRSAYFPRVFQYDVYKNIGRHRRRYEFLVSLESRAISPARSFSAETDVRFLEQLVESDAAAEEKDAAFGGFAARTAWANARGDRGLEWVSECGSFPAFMLKADLLGADLAECAHYMIFHDMFGMLSEWISRDAAGFGRISNAAGMIQYRRRNDKENKR